MRHVISSDVSRLKDDAYRSYLNRFVAIDNDMLKTMSSFQCRIETKEEADASQLRIDEIRKELVLHGAHVRNNGHSITFGPTSPACLRCRTGIRSMSTFISLACNRDCWFCFNPNQHDWESFRNSTKDWKRELDTLKEELGELDFIALTGGEPLLFPDETLAFIAYARSIAPTSHIRLYTSGANADEALIKALAKAGLDEIRFSLKLEDPAQIEESYALMRCARNHIEYILVEMPIIPGTKEQMQAILTELDSIGIFGINLLELCFPLHNARAFNDRGLVLKRDPYKVPYSYGYAGALPIAGSEELALELMLESIEKGTSLSLHWCSLENKNTAQLYEQNMGGEVEILPYRFSSRSFFFEIVRAFENDVPLCLEVLKQSDYAYELDEGQTMIAFDPRALELFDVACARDHNLWLASALIEEHGGSRRFREIGLSLIEECDLESGIITKELTLHDEE